MPKVARITLHQLVILLALISFSHLSNAKLVKDLQQYNKAVAVAKPGDQIVLANGMWHDVELVFKATGKANKPIELTAQTPGKVIITGKSNLSISGEHLIVSGLVFKDGYTPTGEVISFRTAIDELANNTRVTNTVIDNFSHPERHLADLWVAIYGKNNRFDHNSLVNKRNRGVTLAVRLNTEGSEKNSHIIEYNYFGPRQILGANGGETLRIGTSHFSTKYSNTLVRHNFFDRVNGEHEIISNKSSGNVFRGNVIFESQGTLTMRHGHHTLVEGNYIIGNRKPNTGGIRIINEYQTVKNNYLSGLTGHRFRGALVIMNGVPNSSPNRYNQAIEAVMENNIVVNSDYINFGAGSDEERTATPIDSSFRNNLIMGKTNLDAITLYDDVSGIAFKGNIINKESTVPTEIKTGFDKVSYELTKNNHGLLSPTQSLVDKTGFGEIKLPIRKEDTGASFYQKKEIGIAFQSGKTISVEPGTDTLLNALAASSAGDTLLLKNGGEYLLTKLANINHPITIMAKSGRKPIIRSQKPSFLVIENGGALEVENLWFDGAESPDYKGNNIIRTSGYSMNINYSLSVRQVKVTNLDINGYFDFFKGNAGTFADSIEIIDSDMSNITGSILMLNKETDDIGVYSVENLTLSGNTFTDIKAEIATVYRGGFDESTFGPMVVVTDNTLNNVGKGSTHRSGSSMYFHGVQDLHIANSTWINSAPLVLHLSNGEPITVIKDVVMKGTEKIRANNNDYQALNVKYQ
ncbi:Chondroitinase-B [Zhongshania aliphaticivorans]|uniref:Chondroitinase-B n=1 Tax=Zhongshania aliphaticivorans TaxID=1470434 RepID=A0A5S9MWE6_9GAMM|nr:chondroitinase-B domain-containing protein [Zhongshania aliphaticivorans]CAA0081625.1 Chondroitinase-B [Zhongshania aliphaticivorans]CAA0084771.1 Chondroitinase-B [Zhongshania aliphaticivorans]